MVMSHYVSQFPSLFTLSSTKGQVVADVWNLVGERGG